MMQDDEAAQAERIEKDVEAARAETVKQDNEAARTKIVNQVLEHLKATWGDETKCPMCGKLLWYIGDTVYVSQVFWGPHGPMRIGGQVYPAIPVTCKNCGFTAWINAIVAGVLGPEKGDEGESQ